MRKAFSTSASIALAILGAQSAAAAATRCINCNDTQMYNAARAAGASPSPILVWDPADGDVKRFRNYCGALNGVDPGTAGKGATGRTARASATQATCSLQTEELAVTTTTIDLGRALGEVWRATGGTMKGMIVADFSDVGFPTYLPGKPTAHSVVLDGALRGRILDRASEPDIFQMAPGNILAGPIEFILSHGDAFLGFTDSIVITVNVVFADGSKVQVRAPMGENATYVPGSARDNTGQLLPDRSDNMQDYNGRWYYPPGSGDDMNAFLDLMRQLGVQVVYGTTGQGTGVIPCRWNPESNETVCMLPR
ncbi:hypothetical protein DFR29_106165 [Tahibacter aquaticus]|uniref:Uncharacterized protein n=1 Tax=Tahibacter aquaticus TaxID=520092 RepID=A0A4R6YYC7_9GAMM|nr:hypothetical protein [Tahibacter aquaticus]TDR44019.1 hypothetical protein DFR29_106165 [Tahibacter aquaticus]